MTADEVALMLIALANGIDPRTDRPLPADSVCHQTHVVRTLLNAALEIRCVKVTAEPVTSSVKPLNTSTPAAPVQFTCAHCRRSLTGQTPIFLNAENRRAKRPSCRDCYERHVNRLLRAESEEIYQRGDGSTLWDYHGEDDE